MSNLQDPSDKPDNYYNKSRNEMLCYVPEQSSRILDVGCGAGEFGNALKSRRQVEVWGVELSQQAADEAQTKLDRVIVGSIDDTLPLPDGYFDCIVFNDVLEHLVNPWAVLNKIKAFIKPNGHVIASIPNVRYFENVKQLLIHKQWKYEDYGILDKTHLRFFTIASIKEMFITCGYSVNTIEGINGKQFPWKLNLINIIMNNKLHDMKYLQIACQATLNKLNGNPNLIFNK